MNTFGQRLKYMIDKVGITQADIAKYCNVDPALISKYCKDIHEPNSKNLIQICICLDCSPDWISKGIGSENDKFDFSKTAERDRIEKRIRLEKEGKNLYLKVRITSGEIKDMFLGAFL